MKKIIKLSNEQIQTIYNLVSLYEVRGRVDNRKRFKFLKVLEQKQESYEDRLEKFRERKPSSGGDIKKEFKALLEEEHKFIYEDIEIYAKGKEIFEQCFNTGHKTKTPSGVTSSPLYGHSAKIYVEIEDAFMNAKEQE